MWNLRAVRPFVEGDNLGKWVIPSSLQSPQTQAQGGQTKRPLLRTPSAPRTLCILSPVTPMPRPLPAPFAPVHSQAKAPPSLCHLVALVLCDMRLSRALGGKQHCPSHQRSHGWSPDSTLRPFMGQCPVPALRGLCPGLLGALTNALPMGWGASSPEALPAARSPRSRAPNPTQPSPKQLQPPDEDSGRKTI